MRAVVRKLGRGAAAVGAVLCLAVAGWLVWLLPGPQLTAILGFGPVDGVVTVYECHEATDAEGYSTGTDCTGWYVPRQAGEPAREIVLASAAAEHRHGARVEVRTARGRAYELSGTAVFDTGTTTGLLLVPFLAVAAWLVSCARGAAPGDGDGYFFAALGGMVAVIVLAMVSGILVAIGVAVF
ncbi:hypothetical protein [Streptomyces sp. NPDC096339]|uniref:hypothetical protein n=1 Tax=Streptomyces sp. NPDC096339 TaxID=3366086 RepID=UPI0038014382